MPDNFKKDTSIEDEIEKSLQKMVEEETTVAKALVGKNDLPSNMKTADINDGKTRVIPQITDEILREQKNDYSAKNGVHWLDTIEYIKEKLSSERAVTHKTDNNISKKQQ